MSNVENLEDHMAFSCECGCVRFNLLKSGGIECDDCGEKIDSTWGLAQPEQEPVALETVYKTIIQWDEGGGKRSRRELARRIVSLYTTPPQRTWVGLTKDQMLEILREIAPETQRLPIGFRMFADAIEAKLKEKNT